MISFLLFIGGMLFSIVFFGVGFYYIQGFPQNPELINHLVFLTKFPDFGNTYNIIIGIFFIVLFIAGFYILYKWYRKIVVNEIRKGFWKYLGITIAHIASLYILYTTLGMFIPIPTIWGVIIGIVCMYYFFIRIGLYRGYYKRRGTF